MKRYRKHSQKLAIVPRILWIGIGNKLKGDDGVGPTFIGLLRKCKSRPFTKERDKSRLKNMVLFDCGEVPENYLYPIVKANPDIIIVVDAVNFGVEPGTIKVFSTDEIDSYGLSTHTLSLDYFVKWIRDESRAKIFTLGIQVKSCRFGERLSKPVAEAVKLMAKEKIGAEIILEGVVQGIGFRPFLHRVAKKFSLTGWVKNFSGGVKVWVEGNKIDILLFYDHLLQEAPPLATIKNRTLEFKPAKGVKGFKIEPSEMVSGKSRTFTKERDKFVLIPPDISICDDCLRELQTLKDRRYRYPFINCTNCGPRFTIIHDIPYDRCKTTMAEFVMCKDCANEYKDIENRRYHAQPNACPKCGPQVELIQNRGQSPFGDSPYPTCGDKAIKLAVKLLKHGKIIAVKGIGGFHLCCDATNKEAVTRLRKAKAREFKPFAVMSAEVGLVKKYAYVSKDEERLLKSVQRPIVLLKKKKNNLIAPSVAPENEYIGAMLPYTPLHYLITEDLLAIVDTSGNFKDEPLLIDNCEAITKLSGIADYLLVHNRNIYSRCDDSVAKVINNTPVIFRRARGWTPLPIKLPTNGHCILATGAELKNTFCVTRDNLAFVSQHIGDLNNLETYKFYKSTIEHFKKLFGIEPKIVVHDLHPEYLSTKYAYSIQDTEHRIQVQHHYAHIASCMVENEVEPPVIGIAFDGVGYGVDGKAWGGEFLICDYKKFDRIGHLKYIPLPGGDKAAIEPWRMAVSYLWNVFGEDCERFIKRWKNSRFILQMIKQGVNCPLSSSMGRLFDAISSLLGLCDFNTYEGEGAIRLEQVCNLEDCCQVHPYKYEIKDGVVDVSQMMREIVNTKSNISEIATRFHYTIVDITKSFCLQIRKKYSINKVALSGGVFQNKILTELVVNMLETENFIVYTHLNVPPNDGGISLGQAAVAQAIANG
ncbi:MAG: carbamoyltransferase HypF [bacterium]|nr:carbamoyltransferase HypF [bacterium]